MTARVPPSDPKTEALVLGAALLDAECATAAADVLTPQDFYSCQHGVIWEGVGALLQASAAVDADTVRGWLETAGKWQPGFADLFIELTGTIPNLDAVETYAKRVRELGELRRVIGALHEVTANAYGSIESIPEFLDEAESTIGRVVQSRSGDALVTMNDATIQVFEGIEKRSKAESKMAGHCTGLRDMDTITQGFCAGDLVIVAGRPGMGKTSYAINTVGSCIASPACGRSGALPVLVFSAEMPIEQLVSRTLSSDSGVDLSRIRSAMLTRDDWPAITASAGALVDKPMWFHPSRTFDVLTVKRQARKLKRQQGKLGAIVIDYLQLMKLPGKNNQAEELGDVSRELKLMAGELECPVIALSQLNRGCESRTDKRPMISDIKASGSIEQDADTIIFIYRDEVYNPETPHKGVAEIIVGKQRSGPTGMVLAGFERQRTRFYNLDTRRQEPGSTYGETY